MSGGERGRVMRGAGRGGEGRGAVEGGRREGTRRGEGKDRGRGGRARGGGKGVGAATEGGHATTYARFDAGEDGGRGEPGVEASAFDLELVVVRLTPREPGVLMVPLVVDATVAEATDGLQVGEAEKQTQSLGVRGALGQNGEGDEGVVGPLCPVTMGVDLLLVGNTQGVFLVTAVRPAELRLGAAHVVGDSEVNSKAKFGAGVEDVLAVVLEQQIHAAGASAMRIRMSWEAACHRVDGGQASASCFEGEVLLEVLVRPVEESAPCAGHEVMSSSVDGATTARAWKA